MWEVSGEKKAVENLSVVLLICDRINKSATSHSSLPSHTDGYHFSFFNHPFVKECSCSIILYTDIKLRTPVFSLKWCYASSCTLRM